MKLVSDNSLDYSNEKDELSSKEKNELLGILGSLNEQELNELFREVLIPVNYNMMVCPKEVDFIIEKLSMLIGNGINKSLHKSFNPTN